MGGGRRTAVTTAGMMPGSLHRPLPTAGVYANDAQERAAGWLDFLLRTEEDDVLGRIGSPVLPARPLREDRGDPRPERWRGARRGAAPPAQGAGLLSHLQDQAFYEAQHHLFASFNGNKEGKSSTSVPLNLVPKPHVSCAQAHA